MPKLITLKVINLSNSVISRQKDFQGFSGHKIASGENFLCIKEDRVFKKSVFQFCFKLIAIVCFHTEEK